MAFLDQLVVAIHQGKEARQTALRWVVALMRLATQNLRGLLERQRVFVRQQVQRPASQAQVAVAP